MNEEQAKQLEEHLEYPKLMSLREVCDELRKQGCTNLWTQHLWSPSQCRPMEDKWIEAQDRMQQKARAGRWFIRNRYVWFVAANEPTKAHRVYYAA